MSLALESQGKGKGKEEKCFSHPAVLTKAEVRNEIYCYVHMYMRSTHTVGVLLNAAHSLLSVHVGMYVIARKYNTSCSDHTCTHTYMYVHSRIRVTLNLSDSEISCSSKDQ